VIRLFFQGELSTTTVVLIAFAVAIAVAAYYFRETRELAMPHRWLLPILRGLAIALVILMLAGPTIEYRRETGTIPTVNVFVDASESMKYKDAKAGADVSPEKTNQDVNPLTRLDRAAGILLGDDAMPGWLSSVTDTHRVKLFLLSGDSAQPIYDSASPQPAPKAIAIPEDSLDRLSTNLGEPVRASLQAAIGGLSTETVSPEGSSKDSPPKSKASDQVIVILSDGQHNAGESPEEIAKRMGDASVPVFTIGFGRQSEPVDLAILDIDTPPLVASNGRVAGALSIKDLGNQGDRYQVRITSGDKTVWERTLTTENQATRRVAFDFPVADLITGQSKQVTGIVERTRTTLPLQASIEPVSGEYDLSNNSIDYRLSASTRTRRVLIVDSRSRWETRYLRNVFDRDPTWSVETLLLWPDRVGISTLDEEQAAFPNDQKTLAAFDVIVWGDVDYKMVTSEQLGLIRDFVSQGGGIVFVDGERDSLAMMKDTPIGDLIPVRFSANQRIKSPMRLSLTSTGSGRAAMKLLTDAATTAGELEAVWADLQPPTSIRSVKALPGAEVWLEANAGLEQTDAPVLVTRLFGAGQVVYLAMDQTWRWRYRVADLYHARFWNQLLESIMQAPFDVRDQYVALATGAAQYRAGERATIRVQLRDAEGNPATDVVVDAMLKRDGSEAEVTPLRLMDESRGIYQGESGPLEPGDYVTSVRAAGYAASSSVTSSFLVAKPTNRENIRLAQNVGLLSAMAGASGGVYADASDAKAVWDAIAPLSDGKIEIKRFALAQSFFWFFAVLGLLAIEWWLRKKVGLV